MMISTPQRVVILSGVPRERNEVEGSAVAFCAVHSRHDGRKGTNLMRSTKLARFFASLLILLAGALAQAATVTGTVTNMTTNKPATGDTVTLLEPMSGMSEVGHATTNAQGKLLAEFARPGSLPGPRDAPGRGVLYCRAARRRNRRHLGLRRGREGGRHHHRRACHRNRNR